MDARIHCPPRQESLGEGAGTFVLDHSFFGRPLGRSVDSRPRVTAIRNPYHYLRILAEWKGNEFHASPMPFGQREDNK